MKTIIDKQEEIRKGKEYEGWGQMMMGKNDNRQGRTNKENTRSERE